MGIGSGLLMIIAIILTTVGAINIYQIDARYAYVLEQPVARHQMLKELEVDLMNMRRIVTLMALYHGELDILQSAEEELVEVHDSFIFHLESFKHSLEIDNQADAYSLNERLGQMTELRRLFEQYTREIAWPTLEYAKADNKEMVLETVKQGIAMNNAVYAHFNLMSDSTQQYMSSISRRLHTQTVHTLRLMLFTAVMGLIVGFIIVHIIAKAITGSVRDVIVALGEVVKGNFNINLHTSRTDEAGLLIKNTKEVANTLQALINDMNHMSAQHDKGEIDVFLNSSKYMGAYGDVAEQINYMVQSHIDIKKQVISVFTEIANGSFEAQLERQPGKRAFLNESVDNMRANLKRVKTEVSRMIQDSVDGNLSEKIDETRYTGGWREIMTGLNQVADAINKPITEIDAVMTKLSQGKFETKVTGHYKGSFMSIQESINKTIDILAFYISEMSRILSDIADGDLTQNIQRQYVGNFAEIKRSINSISRTLHKTMSEISAASDQVLAGAKQISHSAMELADGSTTQASSVEELSASMEQITQQTKYNAENASTANVLADDSASSAQKGNTAMQQMLEAMRQIRESSGSISKIIKDIQEIAFQTNLLSLNAAVEAARAGEQGKGFGVVAEEVRNLANRSQKSATQTTSIIEDSLSRIEAGVAMAQSTAESLDIIVSNASKVLTIINDIANASSEQNEAISEVSIGLEQISGVVQINSAVSQEAAAAAEELTSQAEVLKHLVEYFKL